MCDDDIYLFISQNEEYPRGHIIMPDFTRSEYWHMPYSGHGNEANWLQKLTSGSPYIMQTGPDSLSIIILLFF